MLYSSLDEASRNNNIEEVNIFLKKGVLPDVNILNEVILYRYTELISLFLSYDMILNEQTLKSCIQSGEYEIFKRVLLRVDPTDNSLMEIITNRRHDFLYSLKEFKGHFSGAMSAILILDSSLSPSFISDVLSLLESVPEVLLIEKESYLSMTEEQKKAYSDYHIRLEVYTNIIQEDNTV
jgi:hypothetical protein